MELEVKHKGLVYLVHGHLRVDYTDAPEEAPIPYCEIERVTVYEQNELETPLQTITDYGKVPEEVAAAADAYAGEIYGEKNDE